MAAPARAPESVGRGPVSDSHHGKRVVAVSYDPNEEVGGLGVPPQAPGRGWRQGSTQRSGELTLESPKVATAFMNARIASHPPIACP